MYRIKITWQQSTVISKLNILGLISLCPYDTVYYNPTIFKDAGIKSDQELLAATVATTNYGNVASKVMGLN